MESAVGEWKAGVLWIVLRVSQIIYDRAAAMLCAIRRKNSARVMALTAIKNQRQEQEMPGIKETRTPDDGVKRPGSLLQDHNRCPGHAHSKRHWTLPSIPKTDEGNTKRRQ